jgi:hypothetical protein
MDIYAFLIILHITGTILGVGGSTFAEVLSIQAQRDGKFTPEEGQMLHATFKVLRVGMVMLLASGFGLLLYYRVLGVESILFSSMLWLKLTFMFIIVINAVLLQAKLVPFIVGGTVSFVTWYAAFIVGSWRGFPYEYLTGMVGYVVALFVVGYLLHRIHHYFIPPKEPAV